jgi:hypothetical protein
MCGGYYSFRDQDIDDAANDGWANARSSSFKKKSQKELNYFFNQ